MSKDLSLQHFEANDFMGIDQSSPIVIDFSKARGNVVKLTGDQGTKKTSTMTALMYVMGAAFRVDTKNFFNQTDEAIDVKMSFKFEGEEYTVAANGSRFVLKRKIKDRYVMEAEPKSILRKIFGNLGVSPMFLKEVPGKVQINWVKETFGVEEEASKKEIRIANSLKELEAQRREVNRDIKQTKGALEIEPMYQNYEASAKKFKEAPSAKKEKEAFEELQNKNIQYDNAKNEVSRLGNDIKSVDEEISHLEKRINERKQALSSMKERKEKGDQWLKDNKSVPKDYEAAQEKWLNISKTIADHEKWKTIVKRKGELDDMEETVNVAAGNIDKLRKQLLELTATYLPKVPGLEIRVKTGIDDEDEGIFYNNKSLAMLSESELWDLFADHIWPAKDVFFIFCENITSLGSQAINNMNKLVKDKKAMIFASEVDRKKDEMSITITSKLN